MPSVARSVNPGSGSAGRRFARQEEGVFSRRSPSDDAVSHRAQCENLVSIWVGIVRAVAAADGFPSSGLPNQER